MRHLALAVLLACAGCDAAAAPADAGRDASGRDAAIDAPRSDAGPDAGDEQDARPSGDGGTDAVVPVDPTFSFIVIPDTQNETLNDTNAERHFYPRLDWIVGHEEELDVRWVLQTGDLCNWDTPTHDQYERASMGLSRLETAEIPFMLTIGNHDTAATCEGGSACPGMSAHVNLRRTGTFNTYFPTTRFPTLEDTFEDDKIDNSYHLMSAGGVDWVIVTMELWPRPEASAWVGEVLAAHPDANGIVFTHDFLTNDGSINGSNGGYGDTSPATVWADVLVHQPNLRFVFSGHEGYSSYRHETGEMGNDVHMFLFNIDDSTNPTRIVEVDTEAATVHAYVYAPRTDAHLTSSGADVMLTDFSFVR